VPRQGEGAIAIGDKEDAEFAATDRIGNEYPWLERFDPSQSREGQRGNRASDERPVATEAQFYFADSSPVVL